LKKGDLTAFQKAKGLPFFNFHFSMNFRILFQNAELILGFLFQNARFGN